MFTNAGHPLPIVVREDGSHIKLTQTGDSPSLAVGQFPGSVYRDDTFDLLPGDRLVLFTDGVSEALENELLRCIVENRKLGASKLGEAVMKDLSQTKSYDDQTLIVITLD